MVDFEADLPKGTYIQWMKGMEGSSILVTGDGEKRALVLVSPEGKPLFAATKAMVELWLIALNDTTEKADVTKAFIAGGTDGKAS